MSQIITLKKIGKFSLISLSAIVLLAGALLLYGNADRLSGVNHNFLKSDGRFISRVDGEWWHPFDRGFQSISSEWNLIDTTGCSSLKYSVRGYGYGSQKIGVGGFVLVPNSKDARELDYSLKNMNALTDESLRQAMMNECCNSMIFEINQGVNAGSKIVKFNGLNLNVNWQNNPDRQSLAMEITITKDETADLAVK